ncbi:MAG: Unknown protein [uncultured Campylobacterales bacterium]|uniref:Outer membrane protein beta-barrel domain-containing protein n=1 Tax=uncultured Campylobacterales bacterium TaxID=352960 RepID=A0A6S6S9S9_9BACT|nr:MAG: Unknown protein [uncultured Campylobacterales bacterium]
MKKFFSILLLSCLVSAQSPAYFGISYGYSEVDNTVKYTNSGSTTTVELQNSPFVEFSLNYRVGHIRMKTALDYRNYEMQNFPFDVTDVGIMQHIYRDLDIGLPIRPFFKIAFGISSVDYSNQSSEPEGVFTFAYGSGIFIDLGDAVKLSFEYQTYRTTDVNYDGVTYDGYESEDFVASYIFRF